MVEGRSREAWQHTSSLMAQQANINRDTKKRSAPYKPAEFDPWFYLDKKRKGIKADDRLPGDVKMLKRVFIDKRGGV